MFEGDACFWEVAIGDVNQNCATCNAGSGEDVSSPDLVGIDTGEVYGDPAAGPGNLSFLLMRLQTANTGFKPSGLDLDVVAHAQFTATQRTGDDGAKTGKRENAVDRQPGPTGVGAPGDIGEQLEERLTQLVDSSSRAGRNGYDRRVGQNRSGQRIFEVENNKLQPVLFFHQVGFCQGDHASGDLQEVEDGQVFGGLGHDALVGGDNEESKIDAANAGKHVFDEIAVTGHVNDAHFFKIPIDVQIEPGEAEVDGHLSFFFFAQAIGIDAAQGFYKRGFAVVNVSGSADYVHWLVRSARQTQQAWA